MLGVVVVAQLVDQSLPTSKVCSLNAVIGKKIILNFSVNSIEMTKIKKKMPGLAHFKIKKKESLLATKCQWTSSRGFQIFTLTALKE